MRKTLRIVFLFIILSNSLFGALLYEDKEGKYTPKQIISSEKLFNNSDNLSKGFSDSIYWLKIDITNEKKLKKKYHVLFKYPLMSSVDGFINTENGIQKQSNGYLIPIEKRKIKDKNIIFVLDIPADTSKSLYVRIDNKYSTHLEYKILDDQQLYSYLNNLNTILVFLFTAISILALYNFLIFLYTKDATYAYYVLYMLASALTLLATFNAIDISNYIIINEIHILFIGGTLLYCFTFLFNQAVFREVATKKMKRVVKYMLIFILSHLLIMVYSPELAMKIYAFYGSGFIITSGLIWLIWYAYKKNHPLVIFISIGWGIFLISTLLYILTLAGILGVEFQYAFAYGSVIEGIVFSLALAYKIKHSEEVMAFQKVQILYAEKKVQLKSRFSSKLKQIIKKEVEKNLEKERLLIKQSKHASMGEMMDAIAHQWKQPLNVISIISSNLNFKSSLSENNISNKDIEENMSKITEQVNHLVETIDEFRKFFRVNVKKEKVVIKKLIEEVIIFEKEILDSNAIKTEVYEQSHIEYNLVPTEFKHVIINSIINAKDAFIENEIKDRKLIFYISKDDEYVKILIQDNAGGIDQKVIDKIFSANFTTKEEGKGTGIGLYLSYQIIEKLNGIISAKNIEQGVEFMIQLPIKDS